MDFTKYGFYNTCVVLNLTFDCTLFKVLQYATNKQYMIPIINSTCNLQAILSQTFLKSLELLKQIDSDMTLPFLHHNYYDLYNSVQHLYYIASKVWKKLPVGYLYTVG